MYLLYNLVFSVLNNKIPFVTSVVYFGKKYFSIKKLEKDVCIIKYAGLAEKKKLMLILLHSKKISNNPIVLLKAVGDIRQITESITIVSFLCFRSSNRVIETYRFPNQELC